MKVYIAGPMTGLPEWNFPAFHAAAADWRREGWEVINPAEAFDGATDLPYSAYVEKDLADLRTCQAIALLPGWDGPTARGSVWERHVAEMMGLEVYDASTFVRLSPPVKPRESILAEADRLVSAARQTDYGHPIEDFTRTGRMWGAILGTADVPPDKVAMCMVALKLSRECNRPKRDNRTDAAGYVKTLELVRERQGLA
jgi:hypothetical protein